jgi:hypothetical protein
MTNIIDTCTEYGEVMIVEDKVLLVKEEPTEPEDWDLIDADQGGMCGLDEEDNDN